jgi:antitoxin component YwqK of YwqJK toxin-antitoxin module
MPYVIMLLVLSITSAVAADSNLIEAPTAPVFDLNDLEQRSEKSKEVKSGWAEYQAQMDEAFEKTVNFIGAETEDAIAIEAGERFLKVFGGIDNPYSGKDEEHLAKIKRLLEARANLSGLSEVTQANSSEDPSKTGRQNSALFRVDGFNEEDWRFVIEATVLSSEVRCPFVIDNCLRESGFNLLPERLSLDKDLRLKPALELQEGVWITPSTRENVTPWKPYSGVAQAYNALGSLVWDLNFLDGQLEGPATRLHPDGQRASQVTFKKGEASGDRSEWYKNGAMKSSSFYWKGVPRKKFSEWYESGQPRVLAKFASASTALLNGKSEAWHANGQLAFKGVFKSGKIFGTHKVYFSSGRLSMEYKLIPGLMNDCPLVRSLLERQSISMVVKKKAEMQCLESLSIPIYKVASGWDVEGNLIWKSKQNFFQLWDENQNLMVDFRERKSRKFYRSGTLKSEVAYDRFHKAFEGKFLYLYESGATMFSGQFYKSERVGNWKKFDPDGTLIKQVCFSEKPPERQVVCL